MLLLCWHCQVHANSPAGCCLGDMLQLNLSLEQLTSVAGLDELCPNLEVGLNSQPGVFVNVVCFMDVGWMASSLTPLS